MEVEIKIPAAQQLLKVVASGVGAVAGPMLKRWEARATADATRIEAKAKADSIGLIAAAHAEARDSLNAADTSIRTKLDFRENVRARVTFQEEKRQRNLESVVRRAADYLGGEEVQEHEVDHDWTATFFSEVQDVSSEKMQDIWAKILAGEVGSPGTTSMRALSILKTLSQSDAELFQRTTRFILANFILKHDETTRSIPNFPVYGEFMRLSHHGLFQLGTALHMNYCNRSEYHFLEEDVVCRIFRDSNDVFDFSIPSHILSPSGEEIYHVVKQHKSDEYIRGLARFLHGRCRAKLAYARIVSADDQPLSHAPFVEIDPSAPSGST